MEDIWTEVSRDISSAMKPFNDKLIYGREKHIAGIVDYLSRAFEQTAAFFNGQLEYIGYRLLTPEERLEHLFESNVRAGYVSIRRTETSTAMYSFKHQDQVYNIYIEVPYLINGCVIYNNTRYYPLLPIVERGGVNVTDDNTVIVKVMRMPVLVGRKPQNKVHVETIGGRQYWDLLVTVKIHQGADTKLAKSTPLILYHFCKLGFDRALALYEVKPGEIDVVQTADVKDEKFEYIMLPNGFYIKALRSRMETDVFFKRVVLSMYKIYITNTQFVLNDILGNETAYYCATLGKYTSSNGKESPMNKLMLHNALSHLETTDLMLDIVAKHKLETVGIVVNDIYDLLRHMFYNIDQLIIQYNPNDLCKKAIGSLDQLMAGVVRRIAKKQYPILNSRKGSTLTPESVKTFCKKASQYAQWIGTTPAFRPEPSVYNGNWLMTVGAKRYQSFDSVESQYGRNAKKHATKKTSTHLLKAHPSIWMVTSPLDIPASSPVATGSINPYLEVDEGGNIIEPSYAKEITHIYD